MKSIILIIFFLYGLNYVQNESEKIKIRQINKKLLEWANEKNFTLSSLIDISSEKDSTFMAKTNIKKNETILVIPNNLMFTVDKALNLIGSKNLRKQFHQLRAQEFLYIQYEDEEYKKEEAFLSYILYLMEFRPKKYQKTKFYEEYKYYLESLKIKSDIKPFILDNEGCEKMHMTYLNTLYKSIKRNYEEEIFIFKGDSYNKKDIYYEDYLPHRINVHNKGINIAGHKTMIPFLNYFETDYINYNSNYTIERDGSIRIYAKRNIQKYEDIIISSPKMSNTRYLLFKGKTYEKLINYYDEYLIPTFGISLYYRFNIQDKELEHHYFTNLLEKDFDENAIEVYKEYLDILKDERKRKDSTGNSWPYEILMNNIKSFKEYIKNYNKVRIYEYFQDVDIRNHIVRIIKGESRILEKAYSFVRKTASKYFDVESVKEIDLLNHDL